MEIRKLTLNDYRGAHRCEIDLDPRLNVFVGQNGAGKSSILDASAMMLSWLMNRIKRSGSSGKPIAEQDIKNGHPFALVGIECAKHGNGDSYRWSLTKVRKGYLANGVRSEMDELREFVKLFQLLPDAEEQPHVHGAIPLFVFYPVGRVVTDIPLRIRNKHEFDVWAAYDEALSGGANFRTFFEWFREREDLENEHARWKDDKVKSADYQFPDKQLEAVRYALKQLMPDFSGLTVRRNPLRMEVSKNGETLTVNQLSDGEKCLMAMAGDLARRLAIANPTLKNPLSGEGVVMIDEVDLHLHPKWQRMVIPYLLETFPRCQFLISTHSPHVITHVQAKNLHLLKQDEEGIHVETASESYGKTVERILEDLMGMDTTRPDPVQKRLRSIYSSIDSGALPEATAKILELKKEIGDDPELIKASVLIKRKELIGK